MCVTCSRPAVAIPASRATIALLYCLPTRVCYLLAQDGVLLSHLRLHACVVVLLDSSTPERSVVMEFEQALAAAEKQIELERFMQRRGAVWQS